MVAVSAYATQDVRAGASRASLAVSPSSAADQHQTRLAVPPLALPAAANDQSQDWPHLRAGFLRLLAQAGVNASCAGNARRLSHSDWLGLLLTSHRPAFRSLPHRGVGLYSPMRAVTGCAGAFHSVRSLDCSPAALNTLPNQRLVDASADRLHLSRVLSSSLIAWFQPSEAPHGRVPKSSRAFHRKEGELPNVGG